ncbi:MAG: tRNA pseudouridine(55) synthase TruB [Patescibacteria group bacterium]
MDGILIINKPASPTSYDIVDQIKKITRAGKVGHAGTLDPFAEGVLIILINNATKLQAKFMDMPKTYIGTLKLGETSSTYDPEGEISTFANPPAGEAGATVDRQTIQNTIKTFIGEIDQVPPIHSAIKVNGVRAYKLAWQGLKPELKSRKIKIYNINILSYEWPYLKIEVDCSRGTYIRSLAHDIGQKLGCGAYLEALIRTKIGKFTIESSVKVDELSSKNWENYLITKDVIISSRN